MDASSKNCEQCQPYFLTGKNDFTIKYQKQYYTTQQFKETLNHVKSIDSELFQRITSRLSPMTATSTFFSGSHNVITVSAATARTDPSAENAAAVKGFFLEGPQFIKQ